MPTYTFAKVELRATKTVKCDACGKRLKRSTTLFQTLSPFNKTSDGELKTREQIMAELRTKEQEWRGDREWCTPCFDATHVRAKDLTAGDVLETAESGLIPVSSVEVIKNAPGYGDTIRINAGGAFETHFTAYDRVVIKPRTQAGESDANTGKHVVVIARSQLYPEVAHPGPAWRWTYDYSVDGGPALCYGTGLTSLRRMLREKFGARNVEIVEAWKPQPTTDLTA